MAVLLVVLLLLLAAPAAAGAEGRYVGLGDSVAAAVDSYVPRFGDWLEANQGITSVLNVSVGGETSTSILGGQLGTALALINDGTDTRVVSVDIGGNDALNGTCPTGWNGPPCPFADNLAALLGQLRTALDNDPGDEQLLVMGYYNPASGLGNQQERNLDAGLFGSDGRIDPAAYGGAIGMTDIIGWLACRFGGTLVDAWPAFKAGGQSLMLDGIHPNALGQEVLAGLFEDPAKGSPTPACPATTPFATTLAGAGDGMLHGIVEPRLAPARWWFEYGATTAYGASTPVQQLPASAGTRDVVAALAPGTCHARLVVENDQGRFAGADEAVTAPGATCETGTGPPVDTTPPTAVLSGKTVQRLGRSVSVIVACPAEACTAAAAGSLGVPRPARTFKLAKTSARITRGGHAKLVLKLATKARSAARRALRKRRKVTATIKVTVRDAAGNAITKHRVLRLKL